MCLVVVHSLEYIESLKEEAAYTSVSLQRLFCFLDLPAVSFLVSSSFLMTMGFLRDLGVQ